LALTRYLTVRQIDRLGNVLGSLAYVLMIGRRRYMAENLDQAFGDGLSRGRKCEIATASMRNLAKTCLEFLKMHWLSGEQVDELLELDGEEHLAEALRQKQGVVLLTAHYGNWELTGARIARAGFPISVIARDHDDPATAAAVNGIRESHGVQVLQRGGVRDALRCLRRNEVVGILPDHNISQGGLLVDFFGRPATTAPGPATYALRTGAAIVPMFCVRQADGRLKAIFEPPMKLVRTGDRAQDVLVNTQRITKVVEEAIRRHPEQWMWIHRRWKSAPPLDGAAATSTEPGVPEP
jgi:KDO2-lipid IV(A) lauroyltransferase